MQQADALAEKEIKLGVVVPEIRHMKAIKYMSKDETPLMKIYRHDRTYPVLKKAIYRLVPHFTFFQEYYYNRFLKQLYKSYVKEFGKPDIIHAQQGLWAGWGCVNLQKNITEKAPLLITEHSSAIKRRMLSAREENLLRKSYRQADRVVAVSSDLKKSMQELVPEVEIDVIPNMADLSDFVLQEDPSKRSKNNIITVASLNSNKRIDLLIRAFSESLKHIPELRLTVVGDGPELNNLKELCVNLKISNKVTFAGQLIGKKINELHQTHGIFVSASRVETFGIVLIEAMATGMPVVSTKSGGPEDFVDEINGMLCESGGIKNAILQVHANYEKYNPVEIRKYVFDNYSYSAVADKIVNYYKSMLS